MATIFPRNILKCRIFHAKSLSLKKPQCRYLSARLSEVGVLETPKSQGTYQTGQLFLHRIFGYRGVILMPWAATVYDKDHIKGHGYKDFKGQTHPYYLVLIDERDMPHTRIDSELVTFLYSERNKQTLTSIPNLDYVSHEDTLPYNTTEKQPITNHMFDELLQVNSISGKFSATPMDRLKDWQNRKPSCLELNNVYRETTENIRVTVMPFYIGSRIVQQTHEYFWRYCIRLENLGEETVQLRERHWRIISLSSTVETVRGRGVKGWEPVFSKAQPVFQYASYVTLQSPSGHKWGTYKMERENGSTFDVRIPPFALESKEDDGGPHGFIV